MWGMMRGFDGGWMVLAGICMFLFWGGIIALIVFGVTRMARHGYMHRRMMMGGGHAEPLDIAKERYAKGEITKEQFDQMKKDLS